MKLVRKPFGNTGKEIMLVMVSNRGIELGFLTRYRDTRTEKHPYKAFKGIGLKATFMGSFYPEDGGITSAIKSVTDETIRN